MTEFLRFALLGVGVGATYALLAQGVVVVYRGSRILNFAYGAFAVGGAYVFFELHVEQEWGFWPAALAAMLLIGLVSAATYLGVMRPMRHASPLARVIATLGVLIVVQALVVLRWGSDVKTVSPSLPDGVVSIGNISIGADRLWLLGLAVVITLVLTGFSRYTTRGLAITGSAENPMAAAALGWSPDAMAVLTWTVGGALAALAGILIAPLSGLYPDQMTDLLLFALAAALVGGFSSFSLALLGGVALGIAGSLMTHYVDQQGAAEALPLLVIVAVLVLRGQSLPVRGSLLERLPRVGSGRVDPRLAVVTVIGLAVLMLTVFGEDLLAATIVGLAWATFMLSVVVLTGYAGQLSLAQFALGGMGAFLAGRLVASQDWAFIPALVAGVAGTALIGMVFALPALRTRGIQLAVVTLGLGTAVDVMLFNNDDYTGGIEGTRVGTQSFLGFDIDAVAHPERYALLVLGAFVACACVVSTVRRGRVGRRLLAMRTNERAAAAIGISVLEGKVFAFALSAGIAAVAGILLAFQTNVIVFDQFDPLQSILVVAYAVIGGVGFIIGPLIGSVIVTGGIGFLVVHELAPSLDRYLMLLGGVVLVVNLVRSADGLAGYERFHALARRWRRPLSGRPLPDVRIERAAPVSLHTRDLTVRFGGVTALDGVDLTLNSGTITGLIGPNGAGKTTLIDALTGFVRPSRGTVTIDGVAVSSWDPHRRARAGVVRSFQSLELFEDMTVYDNLLAACDRRDRRAYLSGLLRSGRGELTPLAVGAVRELDLQDILHQYPGELSYGRRRLVAVCRAVAANASILLLDEPAAGLGDSERLELSRMVARLVENWGIGVLVIEHDVDFVMRISHTVYALEFGRVIASGPPEEIRSDPAVVAAYLGGGEDSGDPSRRDLQEAAER